VKLAALVLGLWVLAAAAVPAESADGKITDAALAEARDVLSRELFAHYDVVALKVVKIDDLRHAMQAERQYGLARATLEFSARRNHSRSPSFSPSMFEPGHPMCQGWLYLHCGVPPGHVFEGRLELLLALDRNGAWKAVSPHWQSRVQYPLHGYLLLEGREMEGYVVFPARRAN
jgi:hypothetical protein